MMFTLSVIKRREIQLRPHVLDNEPVGNMLRVCPIVMSQSFHYACIVFVSEPEAVLKTSLSGQMHGSI
jgi:hypothetical protein